LYYIGIAYIHTPADQEYTFESKQFLQIIVIDVDDEKVLPTSVKDVAEGSILGRVECLLSEVVGARSSTYDMQLTGNRAGKRKYGRIRVQSQELAESKLRPGETLVLHLQGQAIAARDGDPTSESLQPTPLLASLP
jgi:hypothetical protein